MDQTCPKMDFGVWISKIYSGFRISSSKIPIFKQNRSFWVFYPKVAQKLIFGSEFQKSKSGIGISTSKISCVPIFRKNGLLWFFSAQISPKMDLRLEIQKANVRISINILTIPREPIFRLNKNFWLFQPKSRKWLLESQFQKSKSRCRESEPPR